MCFDHMSFRSAPILEPQTGALNSIKANFSKALEEAGAQTIFGLCSYPGDDFEGRVETTVGRANVNLKPSEADLFLPGSRRDAAWFFTDELKDDSCKCTCVTTKDDSCKCTCVTTKDDNHEHNGSHISVGG